MQGLVAAVLLKSRDSSARTGGALGPSDQPTMHHLQGLRSALIENDRKRNAHPGRESKRKPKDEPSAAAAEAESPSLALLRDVLATASNKLTVHVPSTFEADLIFGYPYEAAFVVLWASLFKPEMTVNIVESSLASRLTPYAALQLALAAREADIPIPVAKVNYTLSSHTIATNAMAWATAPSDGPSTSYLVKTAPYAPFDDVNSPIALLGSPLFERLLVGAASEANRWWVSALAYNAVCLFTSHVRGLQPLLARIKKVILTPVPAVLTIGRDAAADPPRGDMPAITAQELVTRATRTVFYTLQAPMVWDQLVELARAFLLAESLQGKRLEPLVSLAGLQVDRQRGKLDLAAPQPPKLPWHGSKTAVPQSWDAAVSKTGQVLHYLSLALQRSQNASIPQPLQTKCVEAILRFRISGLPSADSAAVEAALTTPNALLTAIGFKRRSFKATTGDSTSSTEAAEAELVALNALAEGEPIPGSAMARADVSRLLQVMPVLAHLGNLFAFLKGGYNCMALKVVATLESAGLSSHVDEIVGLAAVNERRIELVMNSVVSASSSSGLADKKSSSKAGKSSNAASLALAAAEDALGVAIDERQAGLERLSKISSVAHSLEVYQQLESELCNSPVLKKCSVYRTTQADTDRRFLNIAGRSEADVFFLLGAARWWASDLSRDIGGEPDHAHVIISALGADGYFHPAAECHGRDKRLTEAQVCELLNRDDLFLHYLCRAIEEEDLRGIKQEIEGPMGDFPEPPDLAFAIVLPKDSGYGVVRFEWTAPMPANSSFWKSHLKSLTGGQSKPKSSAATSDPFVALKTPEMQLEFQCLSSAEELSRVKQEAAASGYGVMSFTGKSPHSAAQLSSPTSASSSATSSGSMLTDRGQALWTSDNDDALFEMMDKRAVENQRAQKQLVNDVMRALMTSGTVTMADLKWAKTRVEVELREFLPILDKEGYSKPSIQAVRDQLVTFMQDSTRSRATEATTAATAATASSSAVSSSAASLVVSNEELGAFADLTRMRDALPLPAPAPAPATASAASASAPGQEEQDLDETIPLLGEPLSNNIGYEGLTFTVSPSASALASPATSSSASSRSGGSSSADPGAASTNPVDSTQSSDPWGEFAFTG